MKDDAKRQICFKDETGYCPFAHEEGYCLFVHDLTRHCDWSLWSKDDPAWDWLCRVMYADENDPEPLFELFLASVPKCAAPFVLDILRRNFRRKNPYAGAELLSSMARRRSKKTGPKVPLWDVRTPLEAAALMVDQCIEKQNIKLSAAVDQVLRMKVWPDLSRATLYNHCTGKTDHGRRRKKRMEALKNPPRFALKKRTKSPR